MKAYGLLTGHDVDLNRLPEPLRKALPRGVRGRRPGQVSNSAFGTDARMWALGELRNALRPLAQAGKLGYILFQLAPWATFSEETLAYLAGLRTVLSDSEIAVEFRHRSWFGPHTQETLRFLTEHKLTYVSIDGPRRRATIPSLPALTTPLAVFRLHGRNFQGFLKQVQGKAPTVAGVQQVAGRVTGPVPSAPLLIAIWRRDYCAREPEFNNQKLGGPIRSNSSNRGGITFVVLVGHVSAATRRARVE